MIALSSATTAAIALQASDSSWVTFVQANVPGTSQGPILINGIHGRNLAERLTQVAQDFPYTVNLIGLVESTQPKADALAIANEFGAYQIHDWWFEPNAQLLQYIAAEAQVAITVLLAQAYPGGLSDAPVDIEAMADIVGVSVPTIRRLVKAGEIPFLRFGRAYRFVPNDVLASLKR